VSWGRRKERGDEEKGEEDSFQHGKGGL
jgi:hypothetical protein